MPRNRYESAQFFNRTRQSEIIDRYVAQLTEPQGRPVVLEVAGLQGVGKSRFLRATRDRLAAQSDPPTLIWVSLDQESSTAAIAPMLSIRRQLPVECQLFDTALLTYWAATTQKRRSIRNDGVDSLAERVLRDDDEFGDEVLSPEFGARVFEAIPHDVARRLDYRADDFSHIDLLRNQPNDLYERLPGYLGRDIARRVGNPKVGRSVFFYDGYDKQSARTLTTHALWLQSLITAMRAGVHVIAAKDRLGWDESELRDIVNLIELGKLPEAECRRMIRRELGDLDREIETMLVEGSGSLPFYLRALIDVYRADIDQRGAAQIGPLPSSFRDVLQQFLDHLGPHNSTLVQMLAAVQYFDEPLYDYLVGAARPTSLAVAMSEFVEWFFVADVGGGLYKTHDLLTDAVRSARTKGMNSTLRSAATHLGVRTNEPPQDGADRLPHLFHALVEAWQSTEDMPGDDVVQLIDIGYNLYDAGFWRGLAQLPTPATDDPQPARVVARYFSALAARRIVGPARGLELLARLHPVRPTLGRHAATFDVELAYLREIRGDYAYARAEFRRLSEQATPFDPSRRDHLRARLYHGDMLIMDGEFADANELLADAYEQINATSVLDRAELRRHRGHAYRFSLQFEAAEAHYGRALTESIDSPSMKAKLWTNIAESTCWYDPVRALRTVPVAIKLNTRLGSKIEVAKAEAARGVALARLGQFAEARNACEAALEISRDIDYPAAGCFARQALVAVEVWSGNTSRADEAYEALLAGLDSLGTYAHLAVIPAWIRGDDAEYDRCSRNVRWISGALPTAGLELIGRA